LRSRTISAASRPINSPVPLGTQHPDIAVIDKATEVGRAQAEIGDQPSGVLKR
jgi:hypothetical protein